MPIDTPAFECEVRLDASGEGYLASLRERAAEQTLAVFWLPRAAVEKAVLGATRTVLEARLDGSIAAYLETADLLTLSSSTLSDLIAAAVAPTALAGEDDLGVLGRLEAELERALDIVRRVQR